MIRDDEMGQAGNYPDDPVLGWLQRAAKTAPRIGLPADHVADAAGIVKSVFGQDWLKEQAARLPRGVAGFFRGHPVILSLSVGDERSVANVMELAAYLRSLSRVDGIAAITPALRTTKMFPSVLLQLAFAYRLMKGGAGVALEPASTEGRLGDIRAQIGGREYLVECYVPRANWSRDRAFDLGERGQREILQAADQLSLTLRILIRLKKPITDSERKRVETVAVALARSCRRADVKIHEFDLARIEVHDISDLAEDTDFPRPGDEWKLYGNADFGVRSRSVSETELNQIRNGVPVESGGIRSRMFVWRATPQPEPVERRARRLARKIERKLGQTRCPDGVASRVLVVESGVGRSDSETGSTMVKHIVRGVFHGHERVGGLLIVSRTWVRPGRHRYEGTWLDGPPEYAFPTGMRDTIQEIDHRENPADDW